MINDGILAEPRRLYVIGDVHGRSDLLHRMIIAIARDLAADLTADCLTVTLGDYIDRGPDSRGVMDRLSQRPFPTKFIPLKGNHETLMQNFLQDPLAMDTWRRNGGLETLHSYGIDVAPLMRGRNYQEAADALQAVLPNTHAAFLASLRSSLIVGRYFLCHAGVRPGVELSQQHEHDLLWIREEFLGSRVNFGKLIVHGHTPTDQPEVLANRINVDTGAFMTGRLSCAVLEAGSVRFLTAK
jgi:Calcineurin-like phosphoesterase